MTIRACVLVFLFALCEQLSSSPLFAAGTIAPCSFAGFGVFLVLAAPSKAEQFADPIACSDSRCSGHGRCHDGGWCDCDANWAGDRCDYFIRKNVASILSGQTDSGQDEVDLCPDECSGHGNCEASLCNCFAGWAGAACAVKVQCPDQCNNPSGVCVDGRCVCEQGFGGSTCAERICQNGCWGHGTCVEGKCACKQGWEGEECDLPVQQIDHNIPAELPPAGPKKPAPLDAAAMGRLMNNASDMYPDHKTNGLLLLGNNASSSARNGYQGKHQLQLDIASQGERQEEEEMEAEVATDALQQDSSLDAANATTQMTAAPLTEQDQDLADDADDEDMQITGVDQDGISTDSGVDTPSTANISSSLPLKQQQQQQQQQGSMPRPPALQRQLLRPKEVMQAQAMVAPSVQSRSVPSLSQNPTAPAYTEVASATKATAAAPAEEAEAEQIDATSAVQPPQPLSARPPIEADSETTDATAAPEPMETPLGPPPSEAEQEAADTTVAEESVEPPAASPSSQTAADTTIAEEEEAEVEPPAASPSSQTAADTAVAEEQVEPPAASPSSQTVLQEIPTLGPPPNAVQKLQAALGSSRLALKAAERLQNENFGYSPKASDATERVALPQLAVGRRVIRSKQATKGGDDDDQCPEENCSGHGTCVSGTCECIGGWNGEACDQMPCPGDCSARGTCLMGTCACPPDFYGAACENARCPGDCNGHGECWNGQCKCERGFGDKDCRPVAPPPALPPSAGAITAIPAHLASALSGWKPPQASCPGDCSGNGRCLGGKCTCFGGYVGPACADYCPNYCNGHGQCTAGACLCLAGFAGEDCSLMTCCSGHGSCEMPDTCVCYPGWMGGQCELQMTCSDPLCSGHGTCAQGFCLCQGGYVGTSCDKPPAECGPCPMGSICDRATGLCLCGGIPCDALAPPAQTGLYAAPQNGLYLRGATMLAKTPASITPGTASPAGTSAGDASAGGTDTATGEVQATSGNSVSPSLALVAGNVPARSCNAPHGVFDAASGMCQCQAPYYGEDCEKMHCPDWDPNSGAPDCSGNGKCYKGQCVCATGYGKGPGKPGPNVCADEVCPVDCGEHGLCKNNQCVCQEGWQGPACRLPKCVNDCSGHGSCYFLNANSLGECVCDSGFALPDCARPAVYAQIPSCPNACSGNGLCFMGKCTCTSGFGGTDCSRASCPSGQSGPSCEFPACPRDCDGKGLCFAGQCMCREGHTGRDCSLPTKCFDACEDVCVANLESEACEFCKGQCLTMTESKLGRHDAVADSMGASLLEVHSPSGHGGPPSRVAQPILSPVSRPLPLGARIVSRTPTAYRSALSRHSIGLVQQQLGGVAAWGYGSESPSHESHPPTRSNNTGGVKIAAATKRTAKRAPVPSAQRAHKLTRKKLQKRATSNATLGSSRHGHHAVKAANVPRPAIPTHTPQKKFVNSVVPSVALVSHPHAEKSRKRPIRTRGEATNVGQRGSSVQQQQQPQLQQQPPQRVSRHVAGSVVAPPQQRLKRRHAHRREAQATVVVQGKKIAQGRRTHHEQVRVPVTVASPAKALVHRREAKATVVVQGRKTHHEQVRVPVTVASHAKATATSSGGKGPELPSGNGGAVDALRPADASHQHAHEEVNRTTASAASVIQPTAVKAAISQSQLTSQRQQKFAAKHKHRHHSEISAKQRHRHHVEVSAVRVANVVAP